jgi:hypothetical protein
MLSLPRHTAAAASIQSIILKPNSKCLLRDTRYAVDAVRLEEWRLMACSIFRPRYLVSIVGQPYMNADHTEWMPKRRFVGHFRKAYRTTDYRL